MADSDQPGKTTIDVGAAGAAGEARRRARPCPVCGAPARASHHPFCSPRCQDVDLGRWLKGSYAIPGRPPGFADEDED